MKKRQNILIIVFALLLILSAVAYFVFIRPMTEKTDEKPSDNDKIELEDGESMSSMGTIFMFNNLTREDIAEIKVKNKEGTFKFVSDKNGEFKIDGYEVVPYDTELFATLLNTTSYTLSKTKVGSNLSDEKMEEYGLSNPQASWTVTDKKGNKYTVYVGDRLLTGGGYYCMFEGRRSAYVLGTDIEKTVLVPIESYVTPLLCGGISQDDYYVTDKFTVYKDGEVICRIRLQDEEDWINPDALAQNIMDYPTSYIPNSTLYYDILFKYMGLYANGCYKLGASDKDFEDIGLDEPKHIIAFDYKEQHFELYFTEKTKDGIYYATSNLMPYVIGICDATEFEYLEYDLIDWIDPYIFQQYITNIASIEVKSDKANALYKLYHSKDEKGNDTLAVTANDTAIAADDIVNFRNYYKSLLAVTAEGYCKDDEYCKLSEEELKALTEKEGAEDLYFSYTTLSGETKTFRFYRYSTGHSLVTVDGVGEFYTYTDLVEKIENDTVKILSGDEVTAYDKK